jgi:hypothetical protein
MNEQPPADPAPAPEAPAEPSPAADDGEAAGSSTMGQAPPSRSDHSGLIAFLGVLALALLLVGAVAAAGTADGWGTGGDERIGSGMGPGMGRQGNVEQEQRRLERMAERMRRQAERLERQAQRRELRAQRQRARTADEPEVVTELSGTVTAQTAADGTTTYLLETPTGSLELDAGPPKYWGQAHPLTPYVGSTVTVTGVVDEADDELSVYTVDGQVIRAPGRPPWAGGPKAGEQPGSNVVPGPTTAPGSTSAPLPTPTPAP